MSSTLTKRLNTFKIAYVSQCNSISSLMSNRKEGKNGNVVAKMAEPRHQPRSGQASDFTEQNPDPDHEHALDQTESHPYQTFIDKRAEVGTTERQCRSNDYSLTWDMTLLEPTVHHLTKHQFFDARERDDYRQCSRNLQCGKVVWSRYFEERQKPGY